MSDSLPDAATPPGSAAPLPRVPDDIREAARHAPDHWIGMVDPAWEGDGAPPVWAVVGQWRSNAAGEVVEWMANPDYRPSPAALGWPRAEDDLDEAMQRAAAGYAEVESVWQVAAGAEIGVLVQADGQPVSGSTTEGVPVVLGFTCETRLETLVGLEYTVLPVAELVATLPEGHELYLNPTGPVAMRIAPDQIGPYLDPFVPAPTAPPEAPEAPEAPEPPQTADAPGPGPIPVPAPTDDSTADSAGERPLQTSPSPALAEGPAATPPAAPAGPEAPQAEHPSAMLRATAVRGPVLREADVARTAGMPLPPGRPATESASDAADPDEATPAPAPAAAPAPPTTGARDEEPTTAPAVPAAPATPAAPAPDEGDALLRGIADALRGGS